MRSKAPGLDWQAYLGAAGLAARPTIVVSETICTSSRFWADPAVVPRLISHG